MNNIAKSIFGLAKNSNGFFKSVAQSEFLVEILDSKDGFVCTQSGYGSNCRNVFAKYDKDGIILMESVSSKNGDSKIIFERKIEGILTSLEIKEIKSLERKVKKLQKEITDRQDNWDSGMYNGTGDILTYTFDNRERFQNRQNILGDQISLIQQRINTIKDVK